MSKLMSERPEIAESAIITHSKFGKYCSVGANTRFCYSELGDFSYISVNSNIFSTKIGKFASLSWNVSVNPANHDYNRFTQHPMLFAAKYGMLPDNKPYYRQYGETSIGNDVWIGCNALIMGGVTIGDGAIIGAEARISRNVPPYSIVVGNNRHLKNRFSDEVIAELLNLKWWDFPIDVIRQNIGLFSKKPDSNTIRLMSEIKNNLNI